MGEKFKLTSLEKQWVMYDVGNSAFTLLITTLIPLYFNALAEGEGLTDVEYLAYWGYAVTISTLIVAVTGPVVGAIADRQGRKKKLFIGTILAGAVGCLCMGFAREWLAFLAIFIIARVAYQISLIIYDSTLSDVTTEDRVDDVSSQGYAWGYIGSVIPFVICLVLVLMREKVGISFETAMMISFIIVAVWWVGVSVPLMKNYRQKYYVDAGGGVAGIFSNLWATFKEMVGEKRIILFVFAFFFYIDGVYTIIDMSTAYGTSLGLDSTGLLLALLVTQIVAFPSAIIMGRLSHKYKAEFLITICIIAYTCIALFAALVLSTQLHFWFLAICVGLFQGGIQALSRSYFTKIIPHEKSGQYFGFLDICGKGASIMGTLVMSVLTQITGDQHIGVGAIAFFFIAGLILFRMSAAETQRTA